MANTITKQTLLDGPRNLVVKITIEGDASGDESATNLIDISTYAANGPTKQAPTNLRIDKIEYDLDNFVVNIEWNATANVLAYSCADGSDCKDFSSIGGLVNPKATGWDGDLDFSTLGLGTESGTIILHMVKKY